MLPTPWERLLAADCPPPDGLEQLAAQLLADRPRTAAFHITPANIDALVHQQIQWLRSRYTGFDQEGGV